MKVKELLKLLTFMDENAEVLIYVKSDYFPVLNVIDDGTQVEIDGGEVDYDTFIYDKEDAT